MTVLIVMVFTFVLASSILGIYLSTVKQRVNTTITDELEYVALSGITVMSSYITDPLYKGEFKSKYPSSFSSDSEGLYIDIPFDNYTARVYVKENVIDTAHKEYVLTSVAKKDANTQSASLTIKEDTTGSSPVYELGKYSY